MPKRKITFKKTTAKRLKRSPTLEILLGRPTTSAQVQKANKHILNL